jgi:hypothetical protein
MFQRLQPCATGGFSSRKRSIQQLDAGTVAVRDERTRAKNCPLRVAGGSRGALVV